MKPIMQTLTSVRTRTWAALALAAVSIASLIIAISVTAPAGPTTVKGGETPTTFAGTIKSGANALGAWGFLMFDKGDGQPGSGYAFTDDHGAFSFSAVPQAGWTLMIAPPANEVSTDDGLHFKPFAAFPRNFLLTEKDIVSSPNVNIDLPPAGNLIIRAYDAAGKLMKAADFKSNGMIKNAYMFGTDLNDEELVSVVANDGNNDWTPDLVIAPNTPYAVQFLFWPTANYGKLWLKADNGGAGFSVAAGETKIIDLNFELARTAFNKLLSRNFNASAACDGLTVSQVQSAFNALAAISDPAKKAAAADAVLANSLRLRDCWEYKSAQDSIKAGIRKGQLNISVKDASSGAPLSGATVAAVQQTHDMLPGIFAGLAYADPKNIAAWALAKSAGFELATTLLPWNLTEGYDAATKEYMFGVKALADLGWKIKAHALVWLFNKVVPSGYLNQPVSAIAAGMLQSEKTNLTSYADKIQIWEVINEVVDTNYFNATFDQMISLANDSYNQIKAAAPAAKTLVAANNESDYGNRYLKYDLATNQPTSYDQSYSKFLRAARNGQNSFPSTDAIGILFYPGFKFSAATGIAQFDGPAMTPSFFYDMLKRYDAFGKDIHITEMSLPSSYQSGWNSGYWREKWTPQTQADYAVRIYTIAYADPQVKAVTWWDVRDSDSDVITGGLIDSAGNQKPIYSALKTLFNSADWAKTTASASSNSSGLATINGNKGEYSITVSKAGYISQTITAVMPNPNIAVSLMPATASATTSPASAQAAACVPKTCSQLGLNCGNQANGCGQTINCGSCTASQSCTRGSCKTKSCTGNACCLDKYGTAYKIYVPKYLKCCPSYTAAIDQCQAN